MKYQLSAFIPINNQGINLLRSFWYQISAKSHKNVRSVNVSLLHLAPSTTKYSLFSQESNLRQAKRWYTPLYLEARELMNI